MEWQEIDYILQLPVEYQGPATLVAENVIPAI